MTQGFNKQTSILLVLLMLIPLQINAAPCVGKFVNPITDICWSCIFPISIGNITVYSGGREDVSNPSNPVCICPRQIGGSMVPMPGITAGFWEPVRLVDVTRTPYCMVGLGGFSFGNAIKKHGAVASKNSDEALKHSFYHVHWYIYPVVYWLELLTDFACLEKGSVDLAYISELDPTWNNDELNFILNPEALLFGNMVAEASCAADCLMANVGFSSDKMFWCAGCQGGLYQFTGHIESHIGGVESSTRIIEKLIARLHRVGLAWETSGARALCRKQVAPLVKKSQYKLQMTYPIPNASGPMACNPFGRTTAAWGGGREFPSNGEDFGYLIWRKRNCCVG
jgi:conjugal transfer pilus assembly protein TraU